MNCIKNTRYTKKYDEGTATKDEEEGITQTQDN